MSEVKEQTEKVDKLTVAELKNIPLVDIIIGKSNPRRSFEDEPLQELAESIREKGVIQPILVRPKDGKYELVCGERRYRASMTVMGVFSYRDKIPATIRELTDEEALELQITENLQRKDVHPMDEAFAFARLLETGKTVEEIAARQAKKVYFINQRLKLNSLIEPLQKAFYHDKITLKDALMVCLLNPEAQTMLWEDARPTDDEEIDFKKIRRFEFSDWRVRQLQGYLNKASFDLNDAELDKTAGACTSCQFNSAVANLFPEEAKNAKCHKVSCYKNKLEIHLKRETEKAMEDPAMVFITDSWAFNNGKIAANLQAQGFMVLKNSEYSSVHDDEYPDWDKFKNYNEDDYDTEDELKEAYQKEVKAYEDRKAKAEKEIATGKYLKAFYFEGDRKGSYTYIMLNKSNSPKAVSNGTPPGKVTSGLIDAEIQKIKDREKRAKELDAEKVQAQIVAALKVEKSLNTLEGLKVTPTDKVLQVFLLSELVNYSNRDIIKKLTGLSDVWGSNKGQDLFEKMLALTDEQIAAMTRLIVLEKHGNSVTASRYSYMVRKLAEIFNTVPIAQIEKEQQERAEKRQKRVNVNIARLQEQKKELQKEEKAKQDKKATKGATKKPTAKKATTATKQASKKSSTNK